MAPRQPCRRRRADHVGADRKCSHAHVLQLDPPDGRAPERDYWGWRGDDKDNYYNFLTKLANGLHQEGLKLQVEGPPDTTTGFDYGDVIAAGADQVTMMTYDAQYQTPSDAGHCYGYAPYAWMRGLWTSALAPIPEAQRYKFVAGLPSEAYKAPVLAGTTANCDHHDDAQGNSVLQGNLTMQDMQAAPGFSTDPEVIESRRDPDSGEIQWVADGWVYDYVDQTSLDAKLELAKSLGITNVSLWVLGGGNAWF
ncbi:hypothetical protein [Wenjunlia tyrosinilytica]|uniref:GH18 domain-containing protein n=1 Tax=Wenjunlia tyrosinilytica TaxID=1544741 RepID=A0A917ZYC8_9ACTN|nr:hypothetical protein [Wenjunlia tyrosinilytica]GGO97140.1 hypothetical protein GCM10012280_58250 [Wenjunlia tyrosinilytica]